MSFDRDYFLPMPNADWSGVRRIMADYADAVGLNQHLLRHLRLPVQDGLTLGSFRALILPLAEARTFWKEHSERNWLTSLLAVCGVPVE